MSGRISSWFAVGLAFSLSAPGAFAQCSTRGDYPSSTGAGIGISSSSAQLSPADLQAAVGPAYWGGCSGLGTTIPSLCANCTSFINISVRFVAGANPAGRGSCGTFSARITQLADGTQRISGGDITIFEKERDSGISCQPYSDRIAHELGHALGLADATSSSCNGQIMGSKVQGQNRSVSSTACDVARDFWTTPAERPPGPGDDDHGPCGT